MHVDLTNWKSLPSPSEKNLPLLMRHEAIEMVCAHFGQGREPPPRCGGVLGVSAHIKKYWIFQFALLLGPGC